MRRRAFFAASAAAAAPAVGACASRATVARAAGPDSEAKLRGALDVEAFRGDLPDDLDGNTAMFRAALAEADNRGGACVRYGRDYELGRIDVRNRSMLWGQKHELRFVKDGDQVLNVGGTGATLYQVRARTGKQAHSCVWINGGAADVAILESTFRGNAADDRPFALVRCQGDLVRVRCHFCEFHTGNTGFYLNDDAGQDVRFEDIDFAHNAGHEMVSETFGINSPGTFGRGARRVMCNHNTITATRNPGGPSFACISIAGASFYQIAGNHIAGYQGHGIWIEDEAQHGLILDNTIADQMPGGESLNGLRSPIWMVRTLDSVISGNRIVTCQPAGNGAINLHADRGGGVTHGRTIGMRVEGNHVKDVADGHGIRNAGFDAESYFVRNHVEGLRDPNAFAYVFQPNDWTQDNTAKDCAGAFLFATGWTPQRTVHAHRNRAIDVTGPRVRAGSWSVLERDPIVEQRNVRAAGGFAGWIDLLELGRHARGTLCLEVESVWREDFKVHAQRVLDAELVWDGERLTLTPLYDAGTGGDLPAAELRAAAGVLQARVRIADGREVNFNCELNGFIRY